MIILNMYTEYLKQTCQWNVTYMITHMTLHTCIIINLHILHCLIVDETLAPPVLELAELLVLSTWMHLSPCLLSEKKKTTWKLTSKTTKFLFACLPFLVLIIKSCLVSQNAITVQSQTFLNMHIGILGLEKNAYKLTFLVFFLKVINQGNVFVLGLVNICTVTSWWKESDKWI